MTALAKAIRLDDIEENEDLASGATKLCFACDPDNPRRVKGACKTCGGTGRQALAAVEIARELKASKQSPPEGEKKPSQQGKRQRRDDSDEGEYFEY